MKRVASRHGGTTPAYESDEMRGHESVSINGLMYYLPDDDDTARAKSEAIIEQSEELELAKAELRAYRDALAGMMPEAQLRAAMAVCGIDPDDANQVIRAWRKVQEL